MGSGHRRSRQVFGAVAVAIAVLAGACSGSSGFERVEEAPRTEGVPMSTTTLLEGSLQSSTTTTTTAAPAAAAVAGAPSGEALGSMVGALATQPGLIAAIGQLSDADPGALAALFGLDEAIIEQLGLTLAEIQGIAAMVAGIDPVELAAAFGSGLGSSIDTSALQGIRAIAGSIDAAAIAAVDGLTRQVIGTLMTALSQAVDVVDPALVALFVALLERLLPPGSPPVAATRSSALVLAVLAAATLRTNPMAAAQLTPYAAADPQLADLMQRLTRAGRALDPGAAAALAGVAAQLTPEGLASLTELVEVLEAPTTRDLFERLAG